MKNSILLSLVLFMSVSCKQAANNSTTDNSTTETTPSKPDTGYSRSDGMPTIAPPPPNPDAKAQNKPVKGSTWKGIQKMTEAEFAEKLPQSAVLTVVDFSAEWCGPCKRQYPILEAIAKEMQGKVNFANIDVDENPNIAAELEISSIPLLVFYKDGKIVHKIVGLQPQAELKATIKEYL